MYTKYLVPAEAKTGLGVPGTEATDGHEFDKYVLATKPKFFRRAENVLQHHHASVIQFLHKTGLPEPRNPLQNRDALV